MNDKDFLTDSDDTGKFIIISQRTGRKYYIEPIGSNRSSDWGSYNPSTGNIENKKGFNKYRGSVSEKDSLITKDNGFEIIHYSGVGCSPISEIEKIDSKYPSIINGIIL